LTCPALTVAEQALLSFARKVNLSSPDIRRRDAEMLMLAGWSELQVAEAVHVTALFSTFNRVANAFGLASQGLLSLYDAPAGDDQSSDTITGRVTQ
jgi:alkylhydroperoxidase family enzyme